MVTPVIKIRNLHTSFFTEYGEIKAVNGIDIDIYSGKTVGVVGESGCGKSVTALSIMRLIPSPPGKIVNGEILYKGNNLLKMPEKEIRKIRGNRISMIFQEPMTSLNPVFTIGNQIIEAYTTHQNISKKEAFSKAVEILHLVGIPSPQERLNEYPNQLSGGMRQRVMIAMALACKPDLLIADEPTTALDVTIQAQILDLINKLRDELGMAVLLITHDLGIIAETTHSVNIMYAGKIVEHGEVEKIFNNPLHPYTKGLLNSIPKLGQHKDNFSLKAISGVVPDLLNLPKGCKFQERCDEKFDKCIDKMPDLIEVEKGHFSRCFLYD